MSLLRKFPVRPVSRLLLFLILCIVVLYPDAQPLNTIAIGESATGELSDAAPTLRYGFMVETPLQVDIRLFPITENFQPNISVLGPSGNQIATESGMNPDGAIEVRPDLNRGIHQILVSGGTGRFLLLLEAVAPAAPPIPLPQSQIMPGLIDTVQPQITYRFASEFDPLIVIIDAGTMSVGPVATLKDAATGESLATLSDRVSGALIRLPWPQTEYLLELSLSETSQRVAYTVCYTLDATPELCAGEQQATTTQPTVQPVSTPVVIGTTPPPATLQPLPPSSVCIAGSATGNIVNVRSGPSTQTAVVTTLSGLNVATVIGKLGDSTWYQVSANGATGWMAAQVVRLGGPCQNVPVVVPTVPAVPATITPSLTASATTQVVVPTAQPTLNFSLPPNYGTTALTSGFVPDPQTVSITSGGAVDVSYIGGGCSGFATSAPDFSVNYTSGAFPLLRFYFVGSGDSTMVVNTPGGAYVCVDDSFGTLHPTVDFNSPASGRYDIWIGSFASGQFVAGTLHITENSGNHP